MKLSACTIVVVVAAAVAPPAAADTCEQWLATFADYDRRVEAIVGGEPEHLLQDLQTLRIERLAGNRPAAVAVRTDVAATTDALDEVEPPAGLATYHDRLVGFHRAGLATADAFLSDDPADDPAALRAVHEALLEYFVEVESLLVAHECPRGDVEAVQEAIRGLRRILDTGALDPPTGSDAHAPHANHS